MSDLRDDSASVTNINLRLNGDGGATFDELVVDGEQRPGTFPLFVTGLEARLFSAAMLCADDKVGIANLIRTWPVTADEHYDLERRIARVVDASNELRRRLT